MTIIINSIQKWNETFQDGVEASDSYVLANDLLFNEKPAIPRLSGSFDGKCYSLTFDYQNHSGFFRLTGGTITNVVIKKSTDATIAEYQGGLTNTSVNLQKPEIIEKKSVVKNCTFIGNIENSFAEKRSGLIASCQSTYYKEYHVSCCKAIGDIEGIGSSGIIGTYFASKGKAFVDKCSFKGNIKGEFNAGIVGSFSANDEGNLTITNCDGEGEIISIGGGFTNNSGSSGICGTNFAQSGYASIHNCKFRGKINGSNGSGIVGRAGGISTSANSYRVIINNCSFEGEIEGNLPDLVNINNVGICSQIKGGKITNCRFKGKINGSINSGIIGKDSAIEGGVVLVQNCHANGTINGSYSNGIVGQEAARRDGRMIVKNCSFKGKINGLACNGIVGGESSSASSSLIISNCCTIASINGSNNGGICGQNPSEEGGITNINNCTFRGKITGENNGGIVANQANVNNTPIFYLSINNCKVFTNLCAKSSGGIIGSNSKASITNCKVSGCISGENSGGICGIEANKNNVEVLQECNVKNCEVNLKVCGTNVGGIFGSNANNPYAENVCVNGVYTGENGAVVQSGQAVLTGEVVAVKPSQASKDGEVINEDIFFVTKKRCSK